MTSYPVHVVFPGRLVFLGFGSIGQGVLPLILRHVGIQPDQITIVTADEAGEKVAQEYGVRFVKHALTRQNFKNVLDPIVGRGDFLLNLSVDVSSLALIKFCWEKGSLYLDTCIEPWPGGYTDPTVSPARRTNYALREEALTLKDSKQRAPTAVLTHGANPGLVSHLVKQALLNIASDTGVTLAGFIGGGGLTNISIHSAGSITLTEGATISGRQVAPGTNHWNANSNAASGAVLLKAPVITVGEEANILAHATTGYSAGDVRLISYEKVQQAWDFLGISDFKWRSSEASIDVGTGARITGKDIFLDTTAWTEKTLDQAKDPEFSFPTRSVALGDVDADGDLEILINAARYLFVFHHDGAEFLDGDANPATTGVFLVMGASANYSTPAVAEPGTCKEQTDEAENETDDVHRRERFGAHVSVDDRIGRDAKRPEQLVQDDGEHRLQDSALRR